MPLIAVLDAIKLSLYHEKDGKHHEPHVHAVYNEYKAVYDFDGRLTRGEMPNQQKRIIAAWILEHQEELYDRWESAMRFMPISRIDREGEK